METITSLRKRPPQLRAWLARHFFLLLTVLLVGLSVSSDGPAPGDVDAQLGLRLAGLQFNFVSWELNAVGGKLVHSVVAPQRYMSEAARKAFLLDYLQLVDETQRLDREIDRVYSDASITDPDAVTAGSRARLAALRQRETNQQLIAEAILQEQVSSVLVDEGFSHAGIVLPPVSSHFTPLPMLLVVSPRDRIERIASLDLQHGLNTGEQEEIEETTDADFDVSSLVTRIGGLSAYPSMLLESSSINWVTNVTAHEWTHHYLTLHPLGWNYDLSSDTRTMNETVANIVGKEVGRRVIARYYPDLLPPESPPASSGTSQNQKPPPFDFRAEMRKTRVDVDRLLVGHQVDEAEAYMEARRQVFVANGYWIRKLNQAYFAFYGAYADEPGAAGEDPVGPAVQKFRAQNPDLHTFVRRMSRITAFAELQSLLDTG